MEAQFIEQPALSKRCSFIAIAGDAFTIRSAFAIRSAFVIRSPLIVTGDAHAVCNACVTAGGTFVIRGAFATTGSTFASLK